MSIEQEIRDLTVAINTLAYAILNKPLPTQTDTVELAEELEAVVELLPVEEKSPKPAPVKELTDEEALAIVSKEKPKAEPASTISKEELQAQCLKLVRAKREIKPKLQAWLKDRGSESLADLDNKYLADFQAFVDAIEG